MKVSRFDRKRDLIIVIARLWGVHRGRRLSLAVDTGAVDTVVTPEVVESLGYSPRDGELITTVNTAIGKEHGYTLIAKRFSALGFTVPECRIHVFDLATGPDIDGLIGLSFLDQFNYEVRSKEGRLCVERAAGEAS